MAYWGGCCPLTGITTDPALLRASHIVPWAECATDAEQLDVHNGLLLEIVEDRHDRRSIIITSQVPVDRWYEIIGDPTIADAILDRLVHNAYRIELTGESLRKQKNPATATTQA